MSKTVCVDLDGVLADHGHWKGVDHFEDPFPGAREFLQALKKVARVIIFTCRCNPEVGHNESPSVLQEKVRVWLDTWNLPYDEIWTKRGKPFAHAYVDDRAVFCDPSKSKTSPDCGYESVLENCKRLMGKTYDPQFEED